MHYLLILIVIAVFMADVCLPAAIIFGLSLSSSRERTLAPWYRGWAGALCGFVVYSAATFAIAAVLAIAFHYFGTASREEVATVAMMLGLLAWVVAVVAGSIHGFFLGYLTVRKSSSTRPATVPHFSTDPPPLPDSFPLRSKREPRRPLRTKLVSSVILAPLLAFAIVCALGLVPVLFDLHSIVRAAQRLWTPFFVLVYGGLLWLVWRPRANK